MDFSFLITPEILRVARNAYEYGAFEKENIYLSVNEQRMKNALEAALEVATRQFCKETLLQINEKQIQRLSVEIPF
jgi:hypothetical protein